MLLRLVRYWLIASLFFLSNVVFASSPTSIPVLCYHNLNPVKPGSMNMTPAKFESQLKWIIDNGFTVIPLKQAVEYLQGSRSTLPNKPIVITADDGWQSNFTYMLPIIKKYNVPVTLFIYPQTISEGKNALTWNELKELQQTGLFDIQSHTYSHPNFKQAKRHMSQEAYEKFVKNELVKSKQILEEKTGTKITILAWPFGIYDDYLEQQAKAAGYDMAFTIGYRSAKRSDKPMEQPRFMIVEGESGKFTSIVSGRAG